MFQICIETLRRPIFLSVYLCALTPNLISPGKVIQQTQTQKSHYLVLIPPPAHTNEQLSSPQWQKPKLETGAQPRKWPDNKRDPTVRLLITPVGAVVSLLPWNEDLFVSSLVLARDWCLNNVFLKSYAALVTLQSKASVNSEPVL